MSQKTKALLLQSTAYVALVLFIAGLDKISIYNYDPDTSAAMDFSSIIFVYTLRIASLPLIAFATRRALSTLSVLLSLVAGVFLSFVQFASEIFLYDDVILSALVPFGALWLIMAMVFVLSSKKTGLKQVVNKTTLLVFVGIIFVNMLFRLHINDLMLAANYAFNSHEWLEVTAWQRVLNYVRRVMECAMMVALSASLPCQSQPAEETADPEPS